MSITDSATVTTTRYQQYLNDSAFDENTDFIDNTLNTPDIVDILDSFNPLFPNHCSEKEFSSNTMFNNMNLYGLMDGSQKMNPVSNHSHPNHHFHHNLLQNPQANNSSNGFNSNNFSQFVHSPSSSSSSSSSSMMANNQNVYNYECRSYSPMLESSEINLENMSSPEMAPVSPNKVCPQSEFNNYSSSFENQVPNLVENPNLNTSNNNNNSNVSIAYQILESAAPIKNEYDEQVSSIVEFLSDQSSSTTIDSNLMLNNAAQSSNPTENNNNINANYYLRQRQQQLCSPQSPASISSSYSIDSNGSQPKTFTTLDIVQCPIIKEEVPDMDAAAMIQYQSIVPTVVDETIVSATFVPTEICVPTVNGTIANNQQVIYSSNDGTSTSYYYIPSSSTTAATSSSISTPSSLSPSTSQMIDKNISRTLINDNQMTSQSMMPSNRNVPSCVHHSNQANRKRTATSGNKFSGNNNNGQHQYQQQKKQRMSKREKQKMMEMYIERYERENKQLISQIELFEKQINFCKKYLSENVAPYIQKQQQQQQPIHQTLQNFIGLVG
ncbi:class B secretin-like G-protein coupled receptor GPRghp2 [Sarcoptes scabiei]|nr:class B secretin-like G-protein coupled receptor GPRghp2 [Sarcoptes scabiei]